MEKTKVQDSNTTSYKGLVYFFIVVICIFTCINIYEYITGVDSQDTKGLNKMGLLEDQAVTVWGGVQKCLGKKQAYGSTTYGDVAKMSNGYSFMPEIDADVSPMVSGMTEAKSLADEIGAGFVYVQCPSKQLDKRFFPEGVMDCSVDKYDAMISALDASDVYYIDMKKVLESTDEDWFDYFYESDHHWRNNGAFKAYLEICNKFEADGISINESYLDVESYEIKEYTDVFLGSHGRMAGPIYAGLDDYELYLPKWDTSYSINVPSIDMYKEGDFEQCLVHYENLEEYSYDYYAYYAYLKEDYELIEIENKNLPDGPSVVVVRDSSAVPVSCFLSSQCSELDILDLRYLEDMNAIDYVREKNPDYIIYMFGTGYLGDYEAATLR